MNHSPLCVCELYIIQPSKTELYRFNFAPSSLSSFSILFTLPPLHLYSRHSAPISSSCQLSRPEWLPGVQQLCQCRGRLLAHPPPFNRTQHDPAWPSTPSGQRSGMDGRSSEQRRLQQTIRCVKVYLRFWWDWGGMGGANMLEKHKSQWGKWVMCSV